MSPILCASLIALSLVSTAYSTVKPLPEKIEQIMKQDKYQHANWGILVKDALSKETFYEKNSNQLFLPGSTTKLFSVAALIHAYGDEYQFRTPVYAMGSLKDGVLKGNLVLVGQGDLTFGGRQEIGFDRLSYTKMDHIYANSLPHAFLTKEDPLNALNSLAKGVRDAGIVRIEGDVLIDDRLFETIELRGMLASPVMINENVFDIVIHPTTVGQPAEISWRPQVAGYALVNACKTVASSEPLEIVVTSDATGRSIRVSGTVPEDQKSVIRTFSIKDPEAFARDAFIQALMAQGIAVKVKKPGKLPAKTDYAMMQPVAIWTSPPLYEYAKLILKVSHNLGADLIPLLLAAQKGSATFDAGMLELGKFTTDVVKVSPDSFVFVDAAGGDQNRLTPEAEVKLLDYVRSWPEVQFTRYFQGLPTLGVDGSLEDFGKGTPAVGKIRAKTGTGISYNFATQQYFLTTQALAGFIEGKNGRLLEFMIAVNNGNMPKLEDIFPIFEDESQIAVEFYNSSE
ncbi:MAG: D-alanyl-D-alanine carboxypeptidase/D-alanyl-D-alanine-endopeptidase [Verrucomicrobia bacterium]|nr:D-alanyl-D-alanine carboxypeptidase/D-alanyl-D-alanine-endopeptidase [Verrucomicrobiota bacterium]